MQISKLKNFIAWIMQLISVGILLPAAYSKLSSQEASIYIFEKLGMEPTGRYLVGILELLACFLLLTPHLSATGAALSVAIMIGALLAHLGVLGLEVLGDHGRHIIMLATVMISSLSVIWIRRSSVPFLSRLFKEKNQ